MIPGMLFHLSFIGAYPGILDRTLPVYAMFDSLSIPVLYGCYLVVLFGVGLIWVGFMLRNASRSYASLLPAAGIVILFVTVFGAHVYYALIDAPLATGCIAVVCIVALWLGRVFDTNLYVLFAVIGAYLTPFLLPVWHANLIDLLIYFSAFHSDPNIWE